MHKPCGYELSLVCSFDKTKNKHNFYRRRDCITRFCNDLKELGTKIVNYEEKEMIPLTDKKKTSSMKSKKNATYVKKSFAMIKMKKRNLKYTKKLEIIVIIQ